MERRVEFLNELDFVMKEKKIDKNLYESIIERLYCFGPNREGPNMLLIENLKPEFSLYKRYALRELRE